MPLRLLCFALVSFLSSQAVAEAPALSLELDPHTPTYRFAITADPLAPIFGRFGSTFEWSLARTVSVSVNPTYERRFLSRGLGAEVGVRLWPMALGLNGMFVGVSGTASTAWAPEALSVHAISAGLELGYQYIFRGMVIGAAVGANYEHAWGGMQGGAFSPRVRIALGYAFF